VNSVILLLKISAEIRRGAISPTHNPQNGHDVKPHVANVSAAAAVSEKLHLKIR